jgi:hypothetical protein
MCNPVTDTQAPVDTAEDGTPECTHVLVAFTTDAGAEPAPHARQVLARQDQIGHPPAQRDPMTEEPLLLLDAPKCEAVARARVEAHEGKRLGERDSVAFARRRSAEQGRGG